MMAFLKSSFLVLTIVATTIFCVLVSPFYLLAYALLGQGSLKKAARQGTWLYGWLVLKLLSPFMPIQVIYSPGAEEAIGRLADKSYILAPNHQSFLDSYLITTQKKADHCFLLRSWPFKKLFFFSPLMKLAGYINTEEKSFLEIQQRCAEEVAQKSLLVGFPEGHRSRDGNLQRFHSGIFMISVENSIPIVPMVIHNSREICPPGKLGLNPAPLIISFLSPIYPEEFKECPMPHRAMLKEVQKRMLQELKLRYKISYNN